MDITMDPAPTPQAPSGPMTRARACVIETEVKSPLFKLTMHTYETWLLPHSETLCILRYEGIEQGDVRKEAQGSEVEKDEEEEARMVKDSLSACPATVRPNRQAYPRAQKASRTLARLSGWPDYSATCDLEQPETRISPEEPTAHWLDCVA